MIRPIFVLEKRIIFEQALEQVQLIELIRKIGFCAQIKHRVMKS